MAWEAWTTLAVLAMVLGLLVFTHIPPDIVLVGGLTLLLVSGVLTPAEALAGLSNPGMVTVAILFVVGAGLRETGAIQRIAQRWWGRPRSIAQAQLKIVVPVAALSAFLNNTPVVAMFIPAINDWARQWGLSVSRLFIPLSYAAILGGTCTLIGTSTNLVVNGLLISAAAEGAGDSAARGLPEGGLGMFDIAAVGLPCTLLGLAYLLLFGRVVLPNRRPAISRLDDLREYTLEMLVEPGSPLVGQTIEEAGLRHLHGTYLMEIDRDGEVLAAVGPEERLAANDRLVFVGVVDSLVDLQKIHGLTLATDQVFKLDAPRSRRTLVEAVVSNTHPLIGKTVREGRFRSIYNAAIIAVARSGHRLNQKIGDIVLQSGDTLLLEAHPSFADQQRNSRDFFLVSRMEGGPPPRYERGWVAQGILAAMVATAALGWLSLLEAAMLAAGLMLITRCVTGTVARRSVDWQVLIVIAAALGIGRAVDATGLAQMVASALIGAAGPHPWLVLAVVCGLTMLFTELITNIAAAVLVFPIAFAAAGDLGVSFMPFAITIMIGASASFATHLGYQTNLMVYGPGGYRYSDYLRAGLPLNLLVGTTTVLIAPLVWPF
ncbi:MAG: SLC13 family permease [bacterium]